MHRFLRAEVLGKFAILTPKNIAWTETVQQISKALAMAQLQMLFAN
jgi:hypothetical protein